MRDEHPPPPTLAWLTRDVTHVWCWCNRCMHSGTVPLETLIARFGPDLRFPEIHGRLRCQACGSKDIHARPDWVPYVKNFTYPDNNGARAKTSADGDDQLRPLVPDTADSF